MTDRDKGVSRSTSVIPACMHVCSSVCDKSNCETEARAAEARMLARAKELRKLPKPTLVQMHLNNGGLMGRAVYMKWKREELVTEILEDEGLK
jgi:hypothetical protein